MTRHFTCGFPLGLQTRNPPWEEKPTALTPQHSVSGLPAVQLLCKDRVSAPERSPQHMRDPHPPQGLCPQPEDTAGQARASQSCSRSLKGPMGWQEREGNLSTNPMRTALHTHAADPSLHPRLGATQQGAGNPQLLPNTAERHCQRRDGELSSSRSHVHKGAAKSQDGDRWMGRSHRLSVSQVLCWAFLLNNSELSSPQKTIPDLPGLMHQKSLGFWRYRAVTFRSCWSLSV